MLAIHVPHSSLHTLKQHVPASMSLCQNLSPIRRRVAVVAASTTAAVVAYSLLDSHRRPIHNDSRLTPAEVQFQTSSAFPTPKGWTGPVWSIRNDYPTMLPRTRLDAPWLHIDFMSDPERYALTIKEYCFDGNRPVDFVVQENTVRRILGAIREASPRNSLFA